MEKTAKVKHSKTGKPFAGYAVFLPGPFDVMGQPEDPSHPTNEEVATRAAANADAIIPFASIDPRRGAEGVREAKRLIEDFGVRGFKFHPSAQEFLPNDRLAYPLYEVI